jgi:hypothetical protein
MTHPGRPERRPDRGRSGKIARGCSGSGDLLGSSDEYWKLYVLAELHLSMGIVDTFADAAEKDSLPYRLCMIYLYVLSGAGAVFVVQYSGIALPYRQLALGVVFVAGYLLATVAIAYVINAEYSHWEAYEEETE